MQNPRVILPPMQGVLYDYGKKRRQFKKGESFSKANEFLPWKNCVKIFVFEDDIKVLKKILPDMCRRQFVAQGASVENANECMDEFFRRVDSNMDWNKEKTNRRLALLELDYKKDNELLQGFNWQKHCEYEFTAMITQSLYKNGEPVEKPHKYNYFIELDLVVHPNDPRPHDKKRTGIYLNETPVSKALLEYKKYNTPKPIDEIDKEGNAEAYSKYAGRPLSSFLTEGD